MLRCNRCRESNPVPGATFCVHCGGPLVHGPGAPPFDAARPLARYDWILAAVVAASMVFGGYLLSRPRWEDLSVLALPIILTYVLAEGFRLRRPWLCGLLAAGQAALFMTSFVIVSKTWRVQIDGVPVPALAVLPALAAGLVAVAVAKIAAILARPLPFVLFERRFHALMVPEGFDDLGLREEALAVLQARQAPASASDGSGRNPIVTPWLEGPERVRIANVLLQKLRDLNMPRIGVTADEVRQGEATRVFPSVTCTACNGAGQVPCPQCTLELPSESTTESLGNDKGLCERCGGEQRVLCECVEKVTFRVPADAPSGFIVRGECDHSEHRHYATVHSEALARLKRPLPVVLLGAVGLPVGLGVAAASVAELVVGVREPGLQAILWLLVPGGIVWAIASIPLLKGRRWGWQLMRLALFALVVAGSVAAGEVGLEILQHGLSLEDVIGFVLCLLAPLAAVGALLYYWHLAPVTAYFGRHSALVEATAPRVFLPVDRLAEVLRLRPVRRLILALAVVVFISFVLDSLPGPYWTVVRASVAEWTRGNASAAELYRDAGERGGSSAVRSYLRHARHRVMLRWLEDQLARAQAQRLDRLEAAEMAELSQSLARERLSLDKNARARAPELLLACSETLIRQKYWEHARQVLRALVKSFSGSPAAVEASERSEWRFVVLRGVSTVAQVAVSPYLVSSGSYSIPEVRHEYLKASTGNRLILVKVELAHLGSTRKEMLSDSFVLTDPEGRVFPGVGIQEDETIGGWDVHRLVSVREYPGVSIGPDLCEATVAFEIPKNAKRFSLTLKGERVSKVSVKS